VVANQLVSFSFPPIIFLMTKYILIAVFIVGCGGFAIGIIGSDQKPSNQNQTLPDNHCTLDKQCADGYVCVKTVDNYIGECGRVVNQTEEK
jgi:hypothetical protein